MLITVDSQTQHSLPPAIISTKQLSFCGVSAHHQNGIFENRNKQLTQGARVLLLHGMRMWPQMIDQMFWPFAVEAAAGRINSLHIDTKGITPESRFYGINLKIYQ